MNGKTLLLTILAVFISFIGGFLLANALNRSELEDLRGENSRLKTSQKDAEKNDLSDEEVKAKIAEVGNNPDDFDAHKKLGGALYKYSMMKQEAKFLPDAAKLLQRAAELNPKDFEVQSALGNIYFDLGQLNKDNESFKKARDYYKNALEIKPNDDQILTDLGLTFFLENPPEYDKAIVELNKSLKINAKNEKTLDGLIRIYLAQGKSKEALEFFNKLKQINPNSRSIAELEAQLAQSKSNQ